MTSDEPAIKSLVWATDLDVIRSIHVCERRPGYWVIRCPSEPGYWWGNFLLFDEPPGAGDGERWERLFASEFAAAPDVRHRVMAWDRTDGAVGAAVTELLPRGYELERTTGLIAAPEALRAHPRASRDVEIRALRPGEGEDEDLWAQVLAVQAAERRDGIGPEEHLAFLRQRQAGRREALSAGRGAWFVALDGSRVVGSLGILVTDGRARYQHVDTLASHRRRGIASRLVVEGARITAAAHPVSHFVIAADPEYHARGIYESLGFGLVESVCGVQKRPPVPAQPLGARP